MGIIANALYKTGMALGRFRAGMAKARTDRQEGTPDEPAKGILVDPMMHYWDPAGYRERPTRMTYEIMRRISHRVSIVTSVINTRVNQAAGFAKLPETDWDIGLMVRPRRLQGKMRKATPTPAERRKMAMVEDWILCCGNFSADRALVGDNFQAFTRKVIRDSLTYDQMNFQIRDQEDGNPYEMIAMPAHTMRLAAPKWTEVGASYYDILNREEEPATIPERGPDDIFAVQVYDGIPIAHFTRRELCWSIRNPRTDIDVGDYGLSEIEQIVHTMNSILNAERYNARFFSQGTAVKGIINFKGPIPEHQLQEFRREWHALLTGVHNAFRTPVTNAEDLQWISMHDSNRDMEYSEWLNYLIKIVTSIYQIDPMELNFQFGNTGQQTSLNQGDQEWKIRQSRARGLRPLLNNYAEALTKHIVWRFREKNVNWGEDFELLFVGLDEDDEATKLQKAEQYTKTVWTVNEARERLYQMEPDPAGDIIRDPYYMQSKQMAAGQAAEGEPQFDDDGDFGAPEGFQSFDEDKDKGDKDQGAEGGPGGPKEPEGPKGAEKSLDRTFTVRL
jgi:hypothetical protein